MINFEKENATCIDLSQTINSNIKYIYVNNPTQNDETIKLFFNTEYKISELHNIFRTSSKQALRRKLTKDGITFEVIGRGDNTVIKLISANDPFKIYAKYRLNFYPNTDFNKVCDYYYCFFNDFTFAALPDEVKERIMQENNRYISRQTISRYTHTFANTGMVHFDDTDYIYYFARKGYIRFAERTEYSDAWKEYWNMRNNDYNSLDAIYHMISKHGGVARKQPKQIVNAIYLDEIRHMCDLIQLSYENKIEKLDLSHTININNI